MMNTINSAGIAKEMEKKRQTYQEKLRLQRRARSLCGTAAKKGRQCLLVAELRPGWRCSRHGRIEVRLPKEEPHTRPCQ